MILAIDISTSIVGWCVGDSTGTIKYYGYVDLRKKPKDLCLKLDCFIDDFFKQIAPFEKDIKQVAVENALKLFTKGKSTAHTINTLVAFNQMVRYAIYKRLNMIATGVEVRSARAKLGIVIPKKKRGQKALSQQKKKALVIEYHKQRPECSIITWETKKTGTYKDHMGDIADAITIFEYMR